MRGTQVTQPEAILKQVDSELKNTLLYFAAAVATFAALYFISQSIFVSATAAVSVLAIGISQAIIRRDKRREDGK